MTYTAFRLFLEFHGNTIAITGNDRLDEDVTHYANNRDLQSIVDISGMTRAYIARSYGIPLRTADQWAAGKAKPPQYVLDLLAYAVIEDKYK